MAEFNRVFRVQGMDSNATPRFQMVPKGGSRFVALHDGAGMTVTNLNPAICTLTEITQAALPIDDRAPSSPGDRYFRIDGLGKGVTFIMATGGTGGGLFGFLPLFLEIGVKEKRKQLIAFNFVTDNAHHKSTRSSADVGAWMPTANYIWKRQANIELVNHGIRRITIAQNLGDPVVVPDDNSLDATFQTIGAAGDGAVDLNVFFLWEIQQSTGDLDAFTSIGTAGTGTPGTCLFEDHAGSGQALSFAHEIGHHLGLDHDTHRRIDLMWPNTGERGFNLTKDDVNAVNP